MTWMPTFVHGWTKSSLANKSSSWSKCGSAARAALVDRAMAATVQRDAARRGVVLVAQPDARSARPMVIRHSASCLATHRGANAAPLASHSRDCSQLRE
jgi:hypothetical protein